eukprot:scaffold40716_cov365-Skeletonema_marinoi.AAC.2
MVEVSSSDGFLWQLACQVSKISSEDLSGRYEGTTKESVQKRSYARSTAATSSVSVLLKTPHHI